MWVSSEMPPFGPTRRIKTFESMIHPALPYRLSAHFRSRLMGRLVIVSLLIATVTNSSWGIESDASQGDSARGTAVDAAPAATQRSPLELPSSVSTYLGQHCVDCHTGDHSEADLDISQLDFDPDQPANFAKWQRILERVRDGEMPPDADARPPQAETDAMLASLTRPLLDADQIDIASKGRVRGRRLTRTEYENSVHDLLGIDLPLKNLLPEDSSAHGFETVADSQQLSHHLLAVYLDVADLALQEAFDRALHGDPVYERFFDPKELTTKVRANYRGPDYRDGKSISWPLVVPFFGRMYITAAPADGWYQVTLRDVHAINPNRDGVVWGTLRSGWCDANSPMLYMIGLVEATKTPRDLVYQAWIRKGDSLELRPNDAELRRPPQGAKGGNVSFVGRDLEKDGFSGIAHRGIEVKRIQTNAEASGICRLLFGDLAPESLVNPAGPELNGGSEVMTELVSQFAQRAFRRSVKSEELAPYLSIAEEVIAEGDSWIEALRSSYRAILCSPRFLTFIEPAGALDDFAIASRLSYALWNSMPDEPLLNLAAEAKLSQPDVLQEQFHRMLNDPRSKRFVNSFADQWLKLNQIDFTTPDTKLYRTFDTVLQESMLQETRAFVAELIHHDLSVTNLIDSDFAMVNERLARHYQLLDRRSTLKLVPGEGVQKVSLAPGHTAHRGGLLTQGAILKVTADGTSTSPIVRGVFVNERILGVHIPPPPPGVPAVEPDIRGATSIRDQLDKHRSNESCAACHKVIDPPGFALESFDPIGGWRTRYGIDGKGVAIDPSGQTPAGEAFDNLSQWKQIYAQRPEQLAIAFAEQFLTYATGAPIRFSDRETIKRMVEDTAESEFGIRSIMEASLLSPVFVNK